MKLLEKILLPVDFTESSERAVAHAIEAARTFKSNIYMIHVIPELNIKGIPMDMVRDNVKKKLSETASVITKAGIGVRDTLVAEGNIVEKILSAADFHDVNVIISGSASSEKGTSLGTTAGKLIRKSSKPVWIVKGGGESASSGILAPVDFSSASRRALKNAVHLARHFRSPLHVLTVVKNINSLLRGIFNTTEEKQKDYEESIRERFDSFISEFDFTGVEVKKSVVSGKPHEEILKYIAANTIGLTVLGSIGDSKDSYTLIGSVAEKVIREVPCSVITVKSEDPIYLKMEAEMHDIEVCTIQGNDLLKNGMPQEALNHFRHCLNIDPLYTKAWDNMAEAYKRLGDENAANEARSRSKEIEDRLWSRRVEAEIRADKYKK
ncbi:MAG: universal stress protein [Spirochaetes bacterium]|nr:universal stress protein [Spirochaetota bacterium]